MAAVALNRADRFIDKVQLKAMYHKGRPTNDWVSATWRDMADDLHHLVASWNILGLKPQDKVAVLGKNRPRWIYSAMSILGANITLVPIYPSLTAEEIRFILHDSGARAIVADTADQARKVLSVMDRLPALEHIFVMDPLEGEIAPPVGSFDGLLERARGKVDMEAIFQGVRKIEGSDLAALIYTSGTTGRPKGVMLSNDNFLSQKGVTTLFDFSSEDIFLNHLPFCHSFGMTADLMGSAYVGATLAIAEGFAPQQIRRGLTTIRPTVLMSVPRLFEKIYVEVQQVVSKRGPRVRTIFEAALKVGKEVFDLKMEEKSIPLSLALKYKLAKQVLMQVRKQAGLDRLRVAYAGGGPSSLELCYFFQSLGIDIYQGYGLTETSPVANVNLPGKNKLGTVGPAIEGVEEKLADDGEILIRGRNVMQGYFNNPEATREAIDGEGWLHTGDIGTFDAEGYLTITDRKKELIVTSGGKNIAPLGIESAYNTERYIERVVVVGDARKYLVALVCPNFDTLAGWARRKGLHWSTDRELSQLPEVIALMEARVAEINRQFARFEQIKKIAVMDHDFSEETGELTPTMKVKRKVVDKLYRERIDSMYPDDQRPN